MVMELNATFNNISVILWQSVLLMEKKPEYPEKTINIDPAIVLSMFMLPLMFVWS
jgi:hypothetical protein